MTDEEKRMAKLPKWARQHIQKLEADAVYLEDKMIQTVQGDHAPASKVTLHHLKLGGDLDSQVTVPEHVQTHYNVDPDNKRHWGSHVMTRLVEGIDGTLYVEVRGDRAVVIEPEAANAFRVRLRDD